MGNLSETGHSWPEVSIVRQHWLSRLPGSARCRLGLGPGAPLGPRPSQLSALRLHGERGSPTCIGLGHGVDLRSTGRSLTGRANAATVAPVFIWLSHPARVWGVVSHIAAFSI